MYLYNELISTQGVYEDLLVSVAHTVFSPQGHLCCYKNSNKPVAITMDIYMPCNLYILFNLSIESNCVYLKVQCKKQCRLRDNNENSMHKKKGLNVVHMRNDKPMVTMAEFYF